MNNEEYARLMMEENGVATPAKLELACQQAASVAEKELNNYLYEHLMVGRNINPNIDDVVQMGIKLLIKRELKDLLKMEDLDKKYDIQISAQRDITHPYKCTVGVRLKEKRMWEEFRTQYLNTYVGEVPHFTEEQTRQIVERINNNTRVVLMGQEEIEERHQELEALRIRERLGWGIINRDGLARIDLGATT